MTPSSAQAGALPSAPAWARGDGYGDGSGCGDGSGYGDGYGGGSGDGSGYGDGYGYGGGYGSGYGGGSKAYWESCLSYFAERLPDAQRLRLDELKAAGAQIAYWRSSISGRAANGGNNAPVTPGLVEEEKGPLRADCGAGQLHATLNPPKWKGERWWIVALLGEVRGDEDKLWALKREIIGECL